MLPKLRLKNKRGQAAMEFLMTYGWAILIAIIAIAALIAFGVLNVGQTTANVCTASTPWGCIEARADASDAHAQVTIQNSGDQAYRVLNVTLKGTYGGSSYTCFINASQARKHDADAQVSYTLNESCPAIAEGSKLKGTLQISYKRCEDATCAVGAGLLQESSGNFAQTVQA
ncbi:MAG: hypothetical protein JSW08_00565 [archaeon]|nr:MAG: hypothetical protein JSW08_00565 [archaeon]